MGIPIRQTLVMWVSPVTQTLTLTQIAEVIWEGNAHITRVLGMGMPKSRGYPYHWDTGPEIFLLKESWLHLMIKPGDYTRKLIR